MQAFIDHLRNTAQALSAQGKKMFFEPKPNPGGYIEFLQKNLDGCGVEFLSNDGLWQNCRSPRLASPNQRRLL